MKKNLLLAVLSLMGVIACGRKVALIPREGLAPASVTDLRVIGRGDKAILLWTAPTTDTRGDRLKGLARFTILRSAQTGPPCGGCGERFEAIYTMSPPENREYFEPGRACEYHDAPLTVGTRYGYKVVSVSETGRTGPGSNVAVLDWDVPPAPPGELRGLAGDRQVLLSWRPSEILVDGAPLSGTAAYNVYRKEGGGEYPLLPVNAVPATETTYTDGGLENHRQYYYTVRTLRKVGNSPIEGPPSNEILLVPYRLDLPPRPEGVVSACAGGGIELTWKKSGDPEVAGYFVFRRAPGEPRPKKITEKPIQEPRYRDTGIRRKTVYLYSIRSVEGPPLERESPPTDEVKAVCR